MPRQPARKPALNRFLKAALWRALRHAPAGIFACLGLAVVINALLMQHGEHPAPLFQTREALHETRMAATPVRAAKVDRIPQERPETVRGRAEPAPSATRPSPDPVVFAVQKALAEAAYGPLQVDGLKGRQTTDALRHFQLDHGLPVNGEIDRQTLDRLAAIGAISENR